MTKAKDKPEIRTAEQIDAEIAELQQKLENIEGTKTEVYTRIVGYYRSVANWNKGKREEYNYRKLYSEPGDMLKPETAQVQQLKKATANPATEAGEKSARQGAQKIASYTFFYRQSCPSCPAVKEYVAALSMPGNVIDVDTEKGMESALQYQVLAAPTVIFFDSKGTELSRAHNTKGLHAIFPGSALGVS